MKEYGISPNVVSTSARAEQEGASVQVSEEDQKPADGEHTANELATALAMVHATLESTTDAILVTDEANYVREFNEKYVKLWGIPPHMPVSTHASEL